MIDFRKLIRQELLKEKDLIDWIAKTDNGAPNLSFNRLPSGLFPCLIYTEISTETLAVSEDNKPYRYETRWQIGIFSSDGTPTKVLNAVENAMIRLGFVLYNNYEYPVDETKKIHRVLNFKQDLTTEEFESLEYGCLWE